MKTLVLLVICCGVFSACTSVTVRRPDSNLAIKHVCIQENPKVWVSDFLPVLKKRLHSSRISLLPSIPERRSLQVASTFCLIRLCNHGTSRLIFLMRNCGLKKMDGKSAMPNTISSERVVFL